MPNPEQTPAGPKTKKREKAQAAPAKHETTTAPVKAPARGAKALAPGKPAAKREPGSAPTKTAPKTAPKTAAKREPGSAPVKRDAGPARARAGTKPAPAKPEATPARVAPVKGPNALKREKAAADAPKEKNPIPLRTPERRQAYLEQARAWCREARPIFICGPARSGTSILTVSLAKHSQLFTPRGVAETFAFAQTEALRNEQVRKGVRKFLGGQNGVKRFQRVVERLDGDGKLSNADVASVFFYFCATSIYPGLRPLEKTPSHVSFLPEMFSVFPHARVIVSLRDPVEIVTSYRKRLQQEQAAGAARSVWNWLDKTPTYLVKRFREIAEDIDRVDAAHASSIFLAPYEWVTADPEEALRQISAFIDLPFEKTMLGDADVGPDDVSNRLAEPIRARPSERAKYLTAEEIALVEKGTSALAERWLEVGTLDAVRLREAEASK